MSIEVSLLKRGDDLSSVQVTFCDRPAVQTVVASGDVPYRPAETETTTERTNEATARDLASMLQTEDLHGQGGSCRWSRRRSRRQPGRVGCWDRLSALAYMSYSKQEIQARIGECTQVYAR